MLSTSANSKKQTGRYINIVPTTALDSIQFGGPSTGNLPRLTSKISRMNFSLNLNLSILRNHVIGNRNTFMNRYSLRNNSVIFHI